MKGVRHFIRDFTATAVREHLRDQAGPGGQLTKNETELVRYIADGASRELRIALTVPDFDEAVGFYRDALGLEQIADWSSEDGRAILLDGGHATLELFDEAQAELIDGIEAGRRVSGTVRFALSVGDSGAESARLAEAGATVVAAPVTTPWGDRNARIQAPDGMQLTLFTSGES